jgi:hypothetical protein
MNNKPNPNRGLGWGLVAGGVGAIVWALLLTATQVTRAAEAGPFGVQVGGRCDDQDRDGREGRAGQPRIVAPHGELFGKTYGEWGAAWWQWVYSIPASNNPVGDTTGQFGAIGQNGPVWFLAGNWGGTTERTLTVPCGKYLFFPIATISWWNPDDVSTATGILNDLGVDTSTMTADQILLAVTHWWENHRHDLEATIDGVPVKNLGKYRAAAPGLFSISQVLLRDWGLPYIPRTSTSEGTWLMLKPLERGPHTIHFKAQTTFSKAAGDPFDSDKVLEVTYHLTVGPAQGPVCDRGIVPPQAITEGLTYGEWGARWWQWAYSIPASNNPVGDTNGQFGAVGQSGPVWFLAGDWGGKVERSVTVPCGKYLFFPIADVSWWNPDDVAYAASVLAFLGVDTNSLTAEQILLTITTWYENHRYALEASIDGVPVKNVPKYRAAAPGLFPISNALLNDWGLPDIVRTSTSEGYWLMLEPLEKGRHTIHFKAKTRFSIAAGDPYDSDSSVEVIYHLTVGPAHGHGCQPGGPNGP